MLQGQLGQQGWEALPVRNGSSKTGVSGPRCELMQVRVRQHMSFPLGMPRKEDHTPIVRLFLHKTSACPIRGWVFRDRGIGELGHGVLGAAGLGEQGWDARPGERGGVRKHGSRVVGGPVRDLTL